MIVRLNQSVQIQQSLLYVWRALLEVKLVRLKRKDLYHILCSQKVVVDEMTLCYY